MFFADFAEISFRRILRNRARYQGVVALIAVGMAGAIVLGTLGRSVEIAVGESLEILGRACLIGARWKADRPLGKAEHAFTKTELTVLEMLPLAEYVTPYVRKFPQRFRSERKRVFGRLLGVEPNFFDALDLRMEVGRPISAEDVKLNKPVCVIGSTIRDELFPGAGNALGRAMWTAGLKLTIVGVLGGLEDRTLARTTLLPISLAQDQLPGIRGFDGFYISAGHWDDVEELKNEVSHILRQSRPGYTKYLEVEHFPSKVRAIKRSVLLVKSLLIVGLTVTLALGGLGIANAMRSAVQDRTREIGLRKAVGATDRQILAQFLAESIGVSVIGAALGSTLGVMAVEALKKPLHTPPDYGIMIFTLVGCLILGVGLGATAGLIPASKAAKLDSAEAIRFE